MKFRFFLQPQCYIKIVQRSIFIDLRRDSS
jgi:hypothetical protein